MSSRLFSTLLVTGFLLIVAGILVMIYATLGVQHANVSYGGVVLIGPIPIIFGGGPYSRDLALIALALTVIVLAFILVFFYSSLKRAGQP